MSESGEPVEHLFHERGQTLLYLRLKLKREILDLLLILFREVVHHLHVLLFDMNHEQFSVRIRGGASLCSSRVGDKLLPVRTEPWVGAVTVTGDEAIKEYWGSCDMYSLKSCIT